MIGHLNPILLTKIARIYAERDAVSMLALGGEMEPDSRLVGEEPQILALANEFGRDAVRTALIDVHKVRIETCKKVLDLHRLLEDDSLDQAVPSSRMGVLVKTVARIFREAEREAEPVFVVRPPAIDENHPKITALMNEYDRDDVLEVLAEVVKIWKKVCEKGLDSATEARRDPGTRLN
jgi:hypothetical protein